MKESDLLRLVMEWLSAKRILAFRQNTGAIKVDQRFIRFGVIGMADIIAFPCNGENDCIIPTWIELKVGSNKQSDYQKSFQKLVIREGHHYILARSLDDVEAGMQ